MKTLPQVIALGLMLAGVASGLYGGWLIYAGAYPPPGGGSLGHVGMIIAGLILCVLAILLAGIGWILRRRHTPRD